MATRKRTAQDKKSKMTVMVLQIEGDDDTLQEGFRALNTALESIAGPQDVRIVGVHQPTQLEAPSVDLEEDEEGEPVIVTRRSASSRRVPRSPQVVELPLAGQSVDLKQFLTPDPESINKRYLLIAYWLKHQLGISSISADHIHTCFRFVGWNTPKDATQPLRDMKSKTHWFAKGESAAHYNINHVGENEVRNLRPDVDKLSWNGSSSP